MGTVGRVEVAVDDEHPDRNSSHTVRASSIRLKPEHSRTISPNSVTSFTLNARPENFVGATAINRVSPSNDTERKRRASVQGVRRRGHTAAPRRRDQAGLVVRKHAGERVHVPVVTRGTLPQRATGQRLVAVPIVHCCRLGVLCLGQRKLVQHAAARRDLPLAIAIAQEAVVADAVEAELVTPSLLAAAV